MSDDDLCAEACAADGNSTDAESENSNDELNVHHFIAHLEAELEELNKGRAELDHLDSMGMSSPAEDEEEMEEGAEPAEALPAPIREEDSSDEEEGAEDEEGGSPALKRPRVEQQQPLPGAKRLWFKQPPPAAYPQIAAASAKKVRKRPAMLKRPAAQRNLPDCQKCRGYQDAACTFCPLSSGCAARVQPARRIYQCIFCSAERMGEAHRTSRPEGKPAAKLDYVFVSLYFCCHGPSTLSMQHVPMAAGLPLLFSTVAIYMDTYLSKTYCVSLVIFFFLGEGLHQKIACREGTARDHKGIAQVLCFESCCLQCGDGQGEAIPWGGGCRRIP